VVTDGRAGIEAQALGLAEAMARERPIDIAVKRIALGAPWTSLPRALWPDPFLLAGAASGLVAPWPDIWIGCGRRAAPFSIAMKRRRPVTFVIQLQHPRTPLDAYDLVIAPEHDGLEGDRVLSIVGSTNRVQAPASDMAPGPHVALAVGGENRAFLFGEVEIKRIASAIETIAAAGAWIEATTSRRTPREAADAIATALKDRGALWRYGVDPPARNPYPGMLHRAAHIFVTADSVNLATEAAATGRPIYILPLTRRPLASARKFERFHDSLAARGAARPWRGVLDNWTYEPLRETARAAQVALHRFDAFSRRRVR
jgi:hypothetical protein